MLASHAWMEKVQKLCICAQLRVFHSTDDRWMLDSLSSIYEVKMRRIIGITVSLTAIFRLYPTPTPDPIPHYTAGPQA